MVDEAPAPTNGAAANLRPDTRRSTLFSGMPDTLFVHNGVGPGMVSPGEPRLRRYSRRDEPGLLRTALARVLEGLRVPEAMRPVTIR